MVLMHMVHLISCCVYQRSEPLMKNDIFCMYSLESDDCFLKDPVDVRFGE